LEFVELAEMTMATVGPTTIPASATKVANPSFVEWGPVLAGAVLAAALSFVFLTFGAAIGLSATSPWPGSGLSAKTIATIAVFFAMVQQIGAFMVGGYIAGRMRTRWSESSADEVEFRDGLHGGLVWAVGIVIGAALALAAAGTAVRAGAQISGAAATAGAPAMDSVIDTMLRPAAAQPAAAGPGAQAPAPAAGTPAPQRERAAGEANPEARAIMTRILASIASEGSISDQNKAYLTQLVAQRTGLPPQEVEARVNQAIAQARAAADKARRATMLTGFVTAVSLIVSFGAAWWAAVRGGNHRDNSVPARFNFAAHRRGGAPFIRS
jgi:hypothetical protein